MPGGGSCQPEPDNAADFRGPIRHCGLPGLRQHQLYRARQGVLHEAAPVSLRQTYKLLQTGGRKL